MLAPRVRAVPITLCSVPLVSMRQLLDEAAAGAYGVGAFNVNNMEQIQAIMEAARETRSPVIVQASRGARAYTNDRFLCHLMQAAVELYPEIPVALHLDHGNDPATCSSAIELGFTSVMMDGSLAGRRQDARSVRVQRRRHEGGRRVRPRARASRSRASSARSGGIEDGHGSGEVHSPDPDQAVEVVPRRHGHLTVGGSRSLSAHTVAGSRNRPRT